MQTHLIKTCQVLATGSSVQWRFLTYAATRDASSGVQAAHKHNHNVSHYKFENKSKKEFLHYSWSHRESLPLFHSLIGTIFFC